MGVYPTRGITALAHQLQGISSIDFLCIPGTARMFGEWSIGTDRLYVHTVEVGVRLGVNCPHADDVGPLRLNKEPPYDASRHPQLKRIQSIDLLVLRRLFYGVFNFLIARMWNRLFDVIGSP